VPAQEPTPTEQQAHDAARIEAAVALAKAFDLTVEAAHAAIARGVAAEQAPPPSFDDIDPPPVQQQIAKVMGDLPGIGKTDKSPQGYNFRGIEAITRQLQQLMAKHGVVIVCHKSKITQVVPAPSGEAQNGRRKLDESWQDVYLDVKWRIYGPAGDYITAETNGVGRDNSDKGANKARTQAWKYLLINTFCIGDGKDDADGHEAYEQQAAAAHQPPKASASQHAEIRELIEQLPPGKRLEYNEWRTGKGYGSVASKTVLVEEVEPIMDWLDEALTELAAATDATAAQDAAEASQEPEAPNTTPAPAEAATAEPGPEPEAATPPEPEAVRTWADDLAMVKAANRADLLNELQDREVDVPEGTKVAELRSMVMNVWWPDGPTGQPAP
jgi:hypothetical protein